MSAETMYSRAGAAVVVDLVVAHLRGHRLLEDRKRAAEAAAFVGTLRRDELDPFTLRQQVERLREGRLVDLRHLGRRAAPRSVAQPLCSPTLCGNSAHGNSRTSSTSCRNSTSS